MENNKKKGLLLTIVAIVTLLVAVGGATFAYFAGTQNLSNLEFNVALPSSNSVFSCNGSTVNLNITPDKMAQGASGTVAGTANGNLVVSYLSGSTTSLSCTYDIAYKWNNGSSAYTKPSSGMEFTYAVSNAKTVNETQFASKDTTDHNIITGESISNASASSATNKTYTVTVKYYNLESNQSSQAGNHYVVDFFCKNIVC